MRALLILAYLIPNLLLAEGAWPPMELKPIEADLVTSFSSFAPADAITPNLTIKMGSIWLIKPLSLTEKLLELEISLKNGSELISKGGEEIEQEIGKVIPSEEQIPYFTLQKKPLLVRVHPDGHFEIDRDRLSPVQRIAIQQRNLIKVLLLFFPFHLSQPLKEGLLIERSGDEMSFRISKISDQKFYAEVLDFRSLPSAALNQMDTTRRKRWGTVEWSKNNIFLCNGEVYSEREVGSGSDKRILTKLAASAHFSSKLVESDE